MDVRRVVPRPRCAPSMCSQVRLPALTWRDVGPLRAGNHSRPRNEFAAAERSNSGRKQRDIPLACLPLKTMILASSFREYEISERKRVFWILELLLCA